MPPARKPNGNTPDPSPAPQGSNAPEAPDPGERTTQTGDTARVDERNVTDAPDATDDAPAKEKRDDAPFYCPGCGRRWNFPTECRGSSESAPHAPIEVVSTDELDGDPEDFTAAPDTTA